MENKVKKYLYNHKTSETAFNVKDYPWGYRLRTTIRYWIESKDQKGCGQRFVRQTINPKTEKWCAPKMSVYYEIVILFLDENEHINYDILRYNQEEETVNKFREIHTPFLDDFQKEQLKKVIAYTNVMKNVEWKVETCPIGPVSLTSQNPIDIEKREAIIAYQEENKKRQQESLRQINRAIAHEETKIIL